MSVRFSNVTAGTVNAAGTCTLTFPAPPLGIVNTGSIVVYDSPNAATWQVTLAGAPIGNTFGTSPCQVQQYPSEAIQVTASNLTPGDQFHATFIGQAAMQGDEPPAANGGSSQAITAGAARIAAVASFNIPVPASGAPYYPMTVPLLGNERSLVILITPTTSSTNFPQVLLSVVGSAVWYTGTVLPERLYPLSTVNLNQSYGPTSVPAYGIKDSTVTVNFAVSASQSIGVDFTATVIAIPDPEIAGSPGNPDFVQIVTAGSDVSATNPLYVRFNSDLFGGNGSSFLSVALPQTTVTQITAGPSANYLMIIDTMTFYSSVGGTCWVSNTSTVSTGTGISVSSTSSASTPTNGPLVLASGQKLWGYASVAGTLNVAARVIPASV